MSPDRFGNEKENTGNIV